MATRVRLAWLFDVDGTLLLTGGAAKEAFERAVRDVLGRVDNLSDIAFAGRIEPQILGDILAKHRITVRDGLVERFFDNVVAHMGDVLHPGRGRLLPGVVELLDAVGREPEWAPTLLTGNMTRMAEIKLRHFGIDRRFVMGAYGEEATTRDELARLAVQRIGERFGIPPERCVVVGDTTHDIDCARAARAHAVAVATGPSSREALAAHGADLVLGDLTEAQALLDFARAVAG